MHEDERSGKRKRVVGLKGGRNEGKVEEEDDDNKDDDEGGDTTVLCEIFF